MMKKKFYQIFSSLLVLLTVFSACKKEASNLFNMFDDLKVDYKSAIAADEVYVEFNLAKTNSGANMGKVLITETGSTTPVYTAAISYTQRYSFSSGVVILKAANPQTVTYKITVLDDAGNDITSQVTITYPTGSLKALNPVLVDEKEVVNFAEGSTVYLDYTITSANADIYSVKLESFANGLSTETTSVIATLTDTDNRRAYRGAARITLNRDGLTRYRIYAYSQSDEFMGDGYKHINTNVIVGYELSANKFVYIPNVGDSTTIQQLPLTAKCFYSINRKQAYTYDEAKEISSDIDFGIYATVTTSSINLNLYSINANPNPMSSFYDFSTWTKRTTLFGPSTTSVAQLNGLANVNAAEVFSVKMVSGAAIKEAVGAGRYVNLLTRTVLNSVVSGAIIYFKNPEGKYGAIFINGFAKDYKGRYFANIDVKIEK